MCARDGYALIAVYGAVAGRVGRADVESVEAELREALRTRPSSAAERAAFRGGLVRDLEFEIVYDNLP